MLLSQIQSNLMQAVGDGLPNHKQDVRKIKDSLKKLNLFDEEHDNDFITHGLDKAIRAFQYNNKLKSDGAINPGGDTETAINKKLSEL